MLNEQRPVISIIVIVDDGNEEAFHCFHSIMEQNYTNYEVLIVDVNASAQVRSFFDEMKARTTFPIKTIEVGKSDSRVKALNEAMSFAEGEYVLFLDPSDTLRNDALDILFCAISQNKGDLAYSSYNEGYFYLGRKHSRKKGVRKVQQAVSAKDSPWVLRDAGYAATGKLYSKNLIDSNKIQFKEEFGAFAEYVFLKELQILSQATVSDIHPVYNRRVHAKAEDLDFMVGEQALVFPDVMEYLIDECACNGLQAIARKELFGSVKQLFNRFAFLMLSPELHKYGQPVFGMYYDYIRENDPSWRSTLCVASSYRGVKGKIQRRIVPRKETLNSLLFDDVAKLNRSLAPKRKGTFFVRHKRDKNLSSKFEYRDRVLAETGSDYLFTVVVPIYNVEPYLEETLDSIVGQTVGFRDNIQLVLVNDGSPDDSGAICRRYLERYPENVVYVEQENAGVSAACNAGLALARGAFVNFMGADDKWSEGAFEEAAKFFEEHPSVSLVSYRMIYFEAATGDHILNFKYSGGTQVIDIQRKYDCPQIEGGAVIMRREAIPADAFRGKLAFQEDTRLVSDVILTSGNYGALSGSSYYYRKRLAATAATDHSTRGYDWHFNSLKGCHQELVNRSIKLYGEIIPYVQFIIMYDLQWRLGHDPFVAGLDRDLASRYKKEIVDLLRLVDDRIIVRQRNIPLCEKLYALSLRHGISFSEAQHCLRIADGQVYFFPPLNSEVKELRPMTWMTSLDEASKVIIHITELKDGKLRLMGTVNSLFPIGSTRFHAAVNGSMQEIPLVCWSHTGSISSFCERDYFCFPSFDVEIPLRDFTQIAFSLSLGDETCKAMPVFCRFTFLSTVKSYHYEQPYLVTRTSDGMGITVERKSVSKEEHLMLEKRYVDSVPKHIINRQLKRLRKKTVLGRHQEKDRETWIITDHLFDARDNGRVLFEYLREHPVPNVDVYFALSKRSSQYKKIKQYGKVVDRDSLKYKSLYLRADKIITSHHEEFVYRPFWQANNHMNDLERHSLVFLQHGVMLHDLSRSLRRTVSGVDLFLTSSETETERIKRGFYLYDDRQIVLTGQPRFDLARTDVEAEKIILVMPTWRSELVLPFEDNGAERMGRRKNPKFVESEFCAFYNDLFSDRELNSMLESSGYRMLFCLHPALAQQKDDFDTSDNVSVLSEFDYSDVLNRGALLVTDYSSIACDFALRRKPVIYNHFDEHDYFESMDRSAGLYDYEKEGFGVVCHSKQSLLKEIGNQISRGCKMGSEYEKRVEEYSFVQPGICCERVVRAIKAI